MAITRAQQAKQLLALGGRIGLQEGGGIEQRLQQLGGDVTSAEQMLQGINQRLKTAESSLGSGGGGLGSIAQPFIGPSIVQPLPGVGPNVGTLIPQPRPGPFMGRPILEPLIEGPVQPLATPLEADVIVLTVGVAVNVVKAPSELVKLPENENLEGPLPNLPLVTI